jgi:hypothetical protein
LRLDLRGAKLGHGTCHLKRYPLTRLIDAGAHAMSTKHLGQKHVSMIVRQLEAEVFDRDTLHRRDCVHRNASISSASTHALPRAKTVHRRDRIRPGGEHARAIASATRQPLRGIAT